MCLFCANIYYKHKRTRLGHFNVFCYCLTCACQAVQAQAPNMGVDNNPSKRSAQKMVPFSPRGITYTGALIEYNYIH